MARNQSPTIRLILDSQIWNLKKQLLFDESTNRPAYLGDYGEVVEVHQREFALTSSRNPKPVLATHGVASCTGFAGWSQEHGVGFLAHYDALTDLPASLEHLLYRVSESVQHLPAKFEVRLLQGDWPDRQTMEFLKARLNMRDDISMKLVEEDVGGKMSKSIALDTRTGQTYTYNPMKNPNRGKVSRLDVIRILSGRSSANLIYSPN
ncbi:hypothetical protein HYT23_06450 [Candidatus Pacearchaeota archaeon]|nr:hypothetical protein [Candidatus Pacearchaeota archaeon]